MIFDGEIFDRAIFDTGEDGYSGASDYPIAYPVKRGRTLDEAVQAIRDDDDLLVIVPALMQTMTQ